MKTTDTLETLKSSTSQLAESTGSVVGGIAGTAKKQAASVVGEVAERFGAAPAQPKRHRGRKLMGIAAGAAAIGWLVKVARGTSVGRQVEERIIDLTGAGRTDEATLERLASEGLDPVTRGDLPT